MLIVSVKIPGFFLLVISFVLSLFCSGELTAQASGNDTFNFQERYWMYRALQRPSVPELSRQERDWSSPVFIPQFIPQVSERTELLFDLALYRQALSHYEKAQDTLEVFRSQVKGVQKERLNVKNPFWWKEIDRLSQLDIEDRRLRRHFNRRLAESFNSVFAVLDKIKSSKIQSNPTVQKLRKTAYRMYAVHQVGVGSFNQALLSLLEYQKYADTNREWPLHFYMSVCYRHIYNRMLTNRGLPEEKLRETRRKKNRHLLQAIELKFGRKSQQFKMIQDKVRLEELGGPRRR